MQISASRCVEAPSRHRRDSCPSHGDVGGFFFEFEAVRIEPRCSAQALADAQKLIAEREQAARDEAQSQIQALQAKLTEIQSASEQAISSFESEKKEAAQVFEGLLKEKDDQLAGFKSDFDKACKEESAKRAEEAAAEASRKTRDELLGKLKDKVAKAREEALAEGRKQAELEAAEALIPGRAVAHVVCLNPRGPRRRAWAAQLAALDGGPWAARAVLIRVAESRCDGVKSGLARLVAERPGVDVVVAATRNKKLVAELEEVVKRVVVYTPPRKKQR